MYYDKGHPNSNGNIDNKIFSVDEEGEAVDVFDNSFSEEWLCRLLGGNEVVTFPFLTAFCRTFGMTIEQLINDAYGESESTFAMGDDFNWQEKLMEIKPKHDVFISGATLLDYRIGVQDFVSLAEKINIRFLAMDIENEEIANQYALMRYNKKESTKKVYTAQSEILKENLYNRLKDKAEFAVADRIMPMAFFAFDIFEESEESFIWVKHYLHETHAEEGIISYIVKPGASNYAIYKKQIEELWKYSRKAREEQTFFDE